MRRMLASAQRSACGWVWTTAQPDEASGRPERRRSGELHPRDMRDESGVSALSLWVCDRSVSAIMSSMWAEADVDAAAVAFGEEHAGHGAQAREERRVDAAVPGAG